MQVTEPKVICVEIGFCTRTFLWWHSLSLAVPLCHLARVETTAGDEEKWVVVVVLVEEVFDGWWWCWWRRFLMGGV